MDKEKTNFNNTSLHCNFCGKSQKEVKKIIKSPHNAKIFGANGRLFVKKNYNREKILNQFSKKIRYYFCCTRINPIEVNIKITSIGIQIETTIGSFPVCPKAFEKSLK